MAKTDKVIKETEEIYSGFSGDSCVLIRTVINNDIALKIILFYFVYPEN